MPLTIPKEYAKGLVALSSLGEDEAASFAGALKDMPETVRQRKDIIAFIKPRIDDSQPGKVEGLIRALLSLYQARSVTEVSLAQFVDELADAVTSSGIPELTLDDASRGRFIKNMKVLLGVETLSFLAKANALQRDHEKIFHTAKIITDLRPVFRVADQDPKDMIVEYTLKVVFHDGSHRHREIYMVLDERDLVRLRESIERAEKKAESLKSLCTSKGIAVLPSLTEA